MTMKNKKSIINAIALDAIALEEDDASTWGAGDDLEEMRATIAGLPVKRTKSGKVHGMKVPETDNSTNKRMTARMIQFVNSLVSGCTHIEAYSQAYDTSGSTRATTIANANRLMKDPRVSMHLESVLEATKQNVIESDAQARQYVMRKLFDQVNDNTSSESGRLRSLELIGKAVGMFTDRVETTVEQVDTEALKKELQSHLHLITDKKKVVTIQ